MTPDHVWDHVPRARAEELDRARCRTCGTTRVRFRRGLPAYFGPGRNDQVFRVLSVPCQSPAPRVRVGEPRPVGEILEEVLEDLKTKTRQGRGA